jgi:hypothetical protein
MMMSAAISLLTFARSNFALTEESIT